MSKFNFSRWQDMGDQKDFSFGGQERDIIIVTF
jgi:hypothetical protein